MSDIIFEALDGHRQYAGVNMDKEFEELARLHRAAASRELLKELLGRFAQPCHPGEPSMIAVVPLRELNRYRAIANEEEVSNER